MDLRTEALSVISEACIYSDPLKGPQVYYKRVKWEVIGYILPGFRSRRFWLKAVRLYLPYVHSENAVNLLVNKNRLYGNRQLYLMGTLGILIRSIDKIERIANIQRSVQIGEKVSLLLDEPMSDSYKDLFNYAILAVLLIDGRL